MRQYTTKEQTTNPIDIDYEDLYWKEVEENIQLQEKIEKLEWQLHLAEIKIKNLELQCGKR